jgi:hypothetical protein
MQRMHPTFAVEFTTAVLVIVAVVSVVLLVLIIVAPWRQVRDEPPMDKSVEAKLLMHRNPDEPTGEVPRVSAVPIDDRDTDPADPGELEDLSDLADHDEPPDPSDPPEAPGA